jgi:tetratricopeptide (TPR) repeat protein
MAIRPSAAPPVSMPSVGPAGQPVVAQAGPSAAAKPAVAHTAASPPSHDETEERISDPKLARARLAEAPALLVACRTSYQEARMKDAEAACTAARDANPGSAEANGFLAHALLNRNRRRESLAAAERAIKLNPKWADAYVVIGGIHQDAGEMADARRAYQRYLELEPHGEFAGELRAIVDRLGKL